MKRILASLLLMFVASIAFSQTSVTLQVTDADSQTWNAGSYSVTLTSAFLNPPTSAVVSGTLSGSGAASFSLGAATYTFRACPLAVSASAGVYGNTQVPCYSSTVAVSGGSQTVTLAPPGIRIPILIGISVKAYADVEVTGAVAGSRYFNFVTGTDRIWNGTNWLDEGVAIPTVFASLPTCAAGLEGLRRSVTDSTTVVFNATITGGGSGHVVAYCNATNWTVH